MSTLKFGVTGGTAGRLPQDSGRPGDSAEYIESLGCFESIWTGEHFANWRPTLTTIPVMGVLIARTRRMMVGSSVMLFPLRHPTVVAKDVCSLDVLSGGRIILGIGVGGENPKEYEACGVPHKQRSGRADEGLQLLKRLWTEDKVTFRGRYFQMEDIFIDPKPIQKPNPPIYVGGRRDSAMRRAALYCNGWMPYLYTPELYRQSITKIQEFAEAAGRDLKDFQWTLWQFTAIEKTYEEAHKVAVRFLGAAYRQDFESLAPKYCVMGNVQQCIERLEEFYEAGVRYFIFSPLGDRHQGIQKVDLIAGEIIPYFQKKYGR